MKKYLLTLQSTPLFTGLDEKEIMSILQCLDASILKKKKTPICSGQEIPLILWALFYPVLH